MVSDSVESLTPAEATVFRLFFCASPLLRLLTVPRTLRHRRERERNVQLTESWLARDLRAELLH